jgi:chromosome segregation ATPase
MNRPCNCVECRNEEKHVNHPFYSKAREEWVKGQKEQILKGAAKYPEPFNPNSWSNEELFNHCLQENVDQLHYIVGMKERMEEQAETIRLQQEKLDNQHNYINSVRKNSTELHDTIEALQATNRSLRKKVTTLENEEDYLQQIRRAQGRAIVKMRDIGKRLLESENRLMSENEALENLKNSQTDSILQYRRKIEALESENKTLKSVVKDLDSENRTLKGEF